MPSVSVFRASVGGYVGAGHVHSAVVDAAREAVWRGKEAGMVADGYVARCGDGIALVLLHGRAPGSREAASWAGDVFDGAAEVAARLHQHGSEGRVTVVEGAELSFEARRSEPVLCFVTDAAWAGSWNMPLYRAFADPFNTPSLVGDPVVGRGFSFAVTNGGSDQTFVLPADSYRLLAAARHQGACIKTVTSAGSSEPAAAVSVGSDPVAIVRCEWPFPKVEEVLEAFAAQCVSGPGPLVPVSANGDASSRAFGRAIALGFQVGPDRLVGPRDLFGDPAFDETRRRATVAADLARRQGPLVGSFTSPLPAG